MSVSHIQWNTRVPLGTHVDAAPGAPADEGGAVIRTRTRSAAWTLGSGTPVVAVEGYPGGIALDHVTIVPVVGMLYEHATRLDPGWKPGPGQKYADAPREVMRVTRDAVYTRPASGGNSTWLTRARWPETVGVVLSTGDPR